MKTNKKALSPIIATALLIFMVLVLSSIVFLWAKGFIKEQVEKFDQPIENVCTQIDFSAELVTSDYQEKSIEVVNRGNIPIYNFGIKKILGGEEEFQAYSLSSTSLDPGDSLVSGISLKMESGSRAEKIIVYPILLGQIVGKEKNSAYTCTGKFEVVQTGY